MGFLSVQGEMCARCTIRFFESRGGQARHTQGTPAGTVKKSRAYSPGIGNPRRSQSVTAPPFASEKARLLQKLGDIRDRKKQPCAMQVPMISSVGLGEVPSNEFAASATPYPPHRPSKRFP